MNKLKTEPDQSQLQDFTDLTGSDLMPIMFNAEKEFKAALQVLNPKLNCSDRLWMRIAR
ncbi:MAG: hypothetical protein K0U68_12890 [Gammaproteobacteria bacterium]|nr:hypothetical protein [Gammaproteobacteria bacterium]